MKNNALIFRLYLWVVFLFAGQIGYSALPENLPPHPRILLNKNELSLIKGKISKQNWATKYFNSLKSNADGWLKREVKLPDRGGQWYHYYSCPEHGARLRTESPTRHVCPVDGKVFTGYPYDDVVITSEHNGYANALKTLGIVYQLTGDKKYADKGKQILLAYAERYNSYRLHNIKNEEKIGGGKVGPQTLDESTWLITMIEGADCIWNELTDSEKSKVSDGLVRPATDIIRKHKMGIHNIQCWKNSAVGLGGLLIGDMALVKEAIEGESGYFNQMKKGITPDGAWYEGAWGYHFYTVSAVIHLTEGAYHSGINLYGSELKKMFDAPISMAMPNLELPAFNDSGSVKIPSQASLYEAAFARYKDNKYLAVIETGSRANINALLYGQEYAGKKPIISFSSANFPNSGYAILCSGQGTDATWFCIDYGPHGGGHGHPDKLGFVLYGFGDVLAPDPGTANYGVPIQANWFRTTIAHNTLTVNETSQKPAEGKCLAFINDKDFDAVLCQAGNIYDGVSFYRAVGLFEGKLLVFVDIVESRTNSILDIAYHQTGKLITDVGTAISKLSDKPGYSQLRSLKEVSTLDGLVLNFKSSSGKDLSWMMSAGEHTRFITGTGVGKHTEDRVPLVIARRNSTTTFIWAVLIGSNVSTNLIQSVSLQKGSASPAAVKIQFNNKTHILVSNPHNNDYVVGGKSYNTILAHFLNKGGNNFTPIQSK